MTIDLTQQPLTIGFDGKRAVSNFTGLGNYSRLVVETLADAMPKSKMLLYAPRMRENSRLEVLLKKPNVEVVTPQHGLGRHLPSLWRIGMGIVDDIKSRHVDLFHGLSNELPLNISKAGIPTIVTIHDLIFRHFPQGYKAIDRHIYDYKFRQAAMNATRIIAISEATRRDIINSYDIDPAKIDVVYQGCDALFRQPVEESVKQQVRSKYSLPESYIVAVGTIEERKNQLLTLKALTKLPAELKAVIVGRNTPYYDTLERFIEQNGLSERVQFIHDAKFEELPALYSMALVAAYTSRIEGFGIPVIEAINSGTPVVSCTGTCLEEAGGPGALYVNPDDADEMAAAVERIISDRKLREQMVTAGKEYVKRFVPERFTADLLEVYSKAIEATR